MAQNKNDIVVGGPPIIKSCTCNSADYLKISDFNKYLPINVGSEFNYIIPRDPALEIQAYKSFIETTGFDPNL